MMAARELQDWLGTLNDGDMVGIDDGGLTIVVAGSDAYLEVGGIPEEEEAE